MIQYPVSGEGEWKNCSAYEVVPGQLCQTLMGMVAAEEASDLAKIYTMVNKKEWPLQMGNRGCVEGSGPVLNQ